MFLITILLLSVLTGTSFAKGSSVRPPIIVSRPSIKVPVSIPKPSKAIPAPKPVIKNSSAPKVDPKKVSPKIVSNTKPEKSVNNKLSPPTSSLSSPTTSNVSFFSNPINFLLGYLIGSNFWGSKSKEEEKDEESVKEEE